VPDVFSQAKRSEVMARIRGRGKKTTEMRFVKLLRSEGLTGWRRHVQVSLREGRGSARQMEPGRRPAVRPDFVFAGAKLAIFIDGCFWHGCPRHGRTPVAQAAFWSAKLTGNRSRDRHVSAALRRRGWIVLRIWEHELRSGQRTARRVRAALQRTEAARGGSPH
jgi:DNA mismatch endonuclease, patch repair protein